MKTTIEVHGYEIKIDEMNDRIMVSAVKDGETVEEFELEVEAGYEDDDMGGMEPFEGEEEEDFEMDDDMEDMDDEEMEEGDDDMDEMDEDEMEEEDMKKEEGKLESFSHFVKRRK